MRIGCFLLCFSLTSICFSQVRLFFQGGMTVSTFNTNLMDDYGFVEYRQVLVDGGVNASSPATNSLRPGAWLGMELDVYLNEDSFLKSGVRYTNGGDSYFFKTPDIQSGTLIPTDGRFKWRPRLDYIGIPLNYGKKFSDFTVYGGLTTLINVATALRTNSFDISNPNNVREEWDRTDDLVAARKTVFMFNVGANYFIPAFDVDQVISINIGYTLNNVYDDPNPFVAGDFNQAKLWMIELGYGVMLRL